MIKLIMNGAGGQMGRTIIRLAKKQPELFTMIAGVDKADISEAEGVEVVQDINAAPGGADIVIDFSRPGALPEVLEYCKAKGIRLIVGTTGLGAEELAMLESAASKIAIFHSGNMSLGVNLQIELVKRAAAALGEGFDPEITEKHHNRKVDAPSGTALMLANAVSSQYPKGKNFVFGRHSKDARRRREDLGIHSIRGGTIVGEHYVEFIGEDEVVEVTHKAYSKQVFGVGALRAAQYLMEKQTGLYSMHDIVTEQEVLSHLYTEAEQSVITIGALPHEPGVLSAIFSTIAKANVFVDMISMTAPGGKHGDVSFSLPKNQLALALNALKSLQPRFEGMDIHAVDNITKLTVEGPGMALRHGVAAELFAVLSQADITIELVTTSETKISLCIHNTDVQGALTVIARHFDL